MLQDVLAETQSTIQPLVPYLDTLRWVLIAIALIGIAVTIHARLDDWKRASGDGLAPHPWPGAESAPRR
nr:hypothetical protein [Pararhodobacter marinus]